MKYIQFIFCICILYLLQGCSESIKGKTASPDFLKSIKSIKIYNKTQNKFIADSIEITDTTRILKIVEEIKKLKEFSISNLRANFGFYELDIIYSNQKSYEIDVVYTTYDGVVISDMNGKKYKNDSLETLILYYFQKPSLGEN
jgi:hypothetical protein